MAVNAKLIKTKIKAVGNTKKITKAMEMIAAAKMRKAVKAANESRSYTVLASEMMGHVARQSRIEHQLTKHGKSGKELIVIISSNRGLCGNFNAAINLKTLTYIKQRKQENPEMSFDVITVGKKAAIFSRLHNLNILQAYDKMPETITFQDVLPVIKDATENFLTGEYEKVSLAYTRFISSLVQKPRLVAVLPVNQEIIDNFTESADAANATNSDGGDEDETTPTDEYKFEPSPEEVIDHALNRVIEAQIFQAFLESSASEHSSRMVAMKNASDAAKDMISSLTLDYNKSRQAAITQEIAEITNASAAIGL